MISEGVKKLRGELVRALIEEGVTAETFDIDSMGFAEMEQLGHGLGRQPAAEIQQALAERQGARLNEQASNRYRCPQCGRSCGVQAGLRRLKTLDGPVEFSEPKCFCPSCRKAFFPSA